MIRVKMARVANPEMAEECWKASEPGGLAHLYSHLFVVGFLNSHAHVARQVL